MNARVSLMILLLLSIACAAPGQDPVRADKARLKQCAESLRTADRERIKHLISLECLGSGKDLCVCERVRQASSDPNLVNELAAASERVGHPFVREGFDFFWADHVPFAKRGISTAEICSLDHAAFLKHGGRVAADREDGSVAHTERDLPRAIRYDNLVIVTNAVLEFLEQSIRNTPQRGRLSRGCADAPHGGQSQSQDASARDPR